MECSYWLQSQLDRAPNRETFPAQSPTLLRILILRHFLNITLLQWYIWIVSGDTNLSRLFQYEGKAIFKKQWEWSLSTFIRFFFLRVWGLPSYYVGETHKKHLTPQLDRYWKNLSKRQIKKIVFSHFPFYKIEGVLGATRRATVQFLFISFLFQPPFAEVLNICGSELSAADLL